MTLAMEHKRSYMIASILQQHVARCVSWPLSMSFDEFLDGNDSVQYLCCAVTYLYLLFHFIITTTQQVKSLFIGSQMRKSLSKSEAASWRFQTILWDHQSLKPETFCLTCLLWSFPTAWDFCVRSTVIADSALSQRKSKPFMVGKSRVGEMGESGHQVLGSIETSFPRWTFLNWYALAVLSCCC